MQEMLSYLPLDIALKPRAKTKLNSKIYVAETCYFGDIQSIFYVIVIINDCTIY